VSSQAGSSSWGASPKTRLGAGWLAWFLCLVAHALLVLALLMVLLGWSTPLPEGFYPRWEGHLISIVGAVGPPILGGLIASRRPHNPYGWLWCALGLALAVLLFAQSYTAYAVANPGTLPVLGLILATGGIGWLLGYASIPPFLMLLFPDGRLPSRRWRFVAWTVAVATVVCVAGGPFMPGEGITSVENPFAARGALGAVLQALVVLGVLAIFVCTILSALSLVFRYRRAGGVERQQIKWFVYAAVVFGGGLIFYSGLLGRDLPGLWDALFETTMLAGLYVTVGIAILRYRLYDVDVVINRTLVYGALTACVVGIYVLVVGYLGAIFRAENNLLVSLAAAGLVAVIFQPLRGRLQRAVNRLMYGERDDPYAVISRLGERLEGTLAPEAVLPTVVETVREALRLPYAAIALEGEIEASTGDFAEEALRLPLSYQNEPVGELLLGRRAGENDFSAADRRLLGDLARQAGIAAHAVLLTADLRRSRERLVTTREEERRRLRRDLHDGLGPTLGSLTLKLDVVRDLVEQDPTTARRLLDGLKEQAQSAVVDIRRLVYALRPPALDDLGLIGAIRETAAQHDTPELDVSVEAPEELPELPAAVEVAAYRIVQEALTNVARHAKASRCSIRLALEEKTGALTLEIDDDGHGFSANRKRGVGITSMRERAEELGGNCLVESSPAIGTRVRASLPYAGFAGGLEQRPSEG
jgi:signal transduction histidine kinase